MYVETDICGRSMKSSLKYADKMNCRYLLVIGEEEVNTKQAKLKDMKTGKEEEIKLDIHEIFSKGTISK